MKLFCSLAWQHTLRYRKLKRNMGYIPRKVLWLLFSEERVNNMTHGKHINSCRKGILRLCVLLFRLFFRRYSTFSTPCVPPLVSKRLSLFVLRVISSNCNYSFAICWLRSLLSAFSFFQVLFPPPSIFLSFIIDFYSFLRNSYFSWHKVLSIWNVLTWTSETNVYIYCTQLSDALQMKGFISLWFRNDMT